MLQPVSIAKANAVAATRATQLCVIGEFMVRTSIQSPAVSFYRNRHHNQSEYEQRPHVWPTVGPSVALEHDAANEPVEIGEGQKISDELRPVGHALKRKHEAREQNVGQKIEDR